MFAAASVALRSHEQMQNAMHKPDSPQTQTLMPETAVVISELPQVVSTVAVAVIWGWANSHYLFSMQRVFSEDRWGLLCGF